VAPTIGLVIAAVLLASALGGCAALPVRVSDQPTSAVTTATLTGVWNHPVGSSSGAPKTLWLTFDSDGSGWAGSSSGDPLSPSASQTFPFRYAIEGTQITLYFAKDGQERFTVSRMSADRFDSMPAGKVNWTVAGTWQRQPR